MSTLFSWFARGLGLIARAAQWVGEKLHEIGERFERFSSALQEFGERIPSEELRKAWREVGEEVSLRERLQSFPERAIIPEELHAPAVFPIERDYAYTVAVHVFDEREGRYTDKWFRVLSDRRMSKEEVIEHVAEEAEHLVEETGTQWRIVSLEFRSAYKRQ